MLSSPLRCISFSRFFSSSTVIDSSNLLLQLLQSSIDHKCLLLTKHAHARVLSHGFNQDSFLATKLISAYSICGVPNDSRLVFEVFHHKNIFLWNSLINGCAKNRIFDEGLQLFNQMCSSHEVSPDDYTLATVLKMAGELRDLKLGEVIHCRSLKTGFVSDTILANSLMVVYSKCENCDYVRKVFDEMPHRSSASWNILISGYAVSGNFLFNEDVWKVVKQMMVEAVRLDAFTVSSLLTLCGSYTGKWDHGREIHCFIIKNDMGFDSDVHLGSCLIDMYSKRKNLTAGKRVFERMSCRNIVAWTSMITGYVQNGCSEEALVLFREMQLRDGIEPNRISLVSILPACSSLSGLMEGKQIHGFSIRRDLNHEISLHNALIDLYSKCGGLAWARRVFDDEFCYKDTISWSSMISGYGLNGKGDEAISLFNEMVKLGLKLDDITLVGVLSACARSGLVTEGLKIYNATIKDYGISPTVEIYACVVDMLGRAGKLSQALEFINAMPMKPGPSVWGALFGACVVHGNQEMQDLAYKALIQLDRENASNHIALSNVYALSGRWDVVEELRRRINDRGLRKLPGCSWISINNKIHSFQVADKTHHCSELIYDMLDDLLLMMKGAGDISEFEYLM